MDLLRTEGDPSRGTQVRYHPSKIYCYPLKLDAAETETIAGPRNVRSNKHSVIFSPANDRTQRDKIKAGEYR